MSHAMHDGFQVYFLSRIPIQKPVPHELSFQWQTILWLRLFGIIYSLHDSLVSYLRPPWTPSSIHIIYFHAISTAYVSQLKRPRNAVSVSHCPISIAAIKTHKSEIWILPKVENNNNHPPRATLASESIRTSLLKITYAPK